MLKYAYAMGVQAAYDEAGVKTAAPMGPPIGGLRRLWRAGVATPKGRALMGAGALGLGAAGTAGAVAATRPEEPEGWASQLGSTLRGILQSPQLAQGLSALSGSAGTGAFGATPQGMYEPRFHAGYANPEGFMPGQQPGQSGPYYSQY